MNPQKVNEEIARFRGWTSKKVPSDEDVTKQGYDEFRHTWWYNREGEIKPLPDYSNRPTLIAKLELELSKEEYRFYNDLIYNNVKVRLSENLDSEPVQVATSLIRELLKLTTQDRAKLILETYRKFRT